MNLRDEEILQQYFDRNMSSSQEQNFLIDVAARDDMRLAFRSHLELLKAIRADKDLATMAVVRSSTLAALGLGANLLPNSLKEQETAQAVAASAGSSVWNVIRRPASMLIAGLLAGSALTYSLLPGTTPPVSKPVTQQTVAAPTTITISEPAKEVLPAPSLMTNSSPVHTTSSKVLSSKNVTGNGSEAQSNDVPLVKKTKSSSIQVQTTVHPPTENQK